jgi:hypothetical protein
VNGPTDLQTYRLIFSQYSGIGSHSFGCSYRKQAAEKRCIEYSDHLKQVENNNKWKEFTNLKPGTYMTYKSRQYGEKDGHKLMKAIIAQKKSYNNEQERKRQKNQKK